MQEIPRLKNRISLIITLLTGVVLLAACFLASIISVNGLDLAFDELFSVQFETISAQLKNRNTINMVEIYQFEKTSNAVVGIYENGTAVDYPIPHGSKMAKDVIAQAEGEFLPKNQFSDTAGLHTVSLGSFGEWRGEYRVIHWGNGGWYGLLVLKSVKELKAEKSRTVLLFSVILAVSLGGLYLISRILANIAARPVQEAYQRQLEFTAAAGHDLRTPISVIKSSAQIIEKDASTAKHNADKIVVQADRLTRLVNDLLVLSAGEAHILQMNCEEIDVESVLILLYEQMQPLAQEKGFEINLWLPDAIIPKVFADSGRVYQILESLLSNALCYSTPGTSIDIKVECRKKHVAVRVADHGGGIKQEDRERVFKQFYRADKSRTKKEHFGLGLPIARELASLQGADIELEDTPGGGATFTLKLKAATK